MDNRLELTDYQVKAFNQLIDACKKCQENGIGLIFDKDDTSLLAINTNDISNYVCINGVTEYDSETDTTDMPFVRTNALIIDSSYNKVGIESKGNGAANHCSTISHIQ